ncbi:MAG: hypothetical protein Q8K78_07105 [Planctomycetaceae bacterium]|nr:hypothetical protein [Planctomycetaceae bacterium]
MDDSPPNNGHSLLGDSGGSLEPGRQSTMLAARAIRERWPMDEATRLAVLDRLRAVVNDPAVSPRESIAACKALIAADAVNLNAERLDLAREAVAKPVPTSNNVTILESTDWYGTASALREKAEQYGLTESRLLTMIESNGDHASVQERIQGAIAADPDYAEFLRARALGTLPKPSTTPKEN